MDTSDIVLDLKRAEEALGAAMRNFEEKDLLTAANRVFVACENTVYVFLKRKFGSTSISRKRILTHLKEINPKLKLIYDQAYDLRVQADYGRKAVHVPLNKENVEKILADVRSFIEDIKKE